MDFGQFFENLNKDVIDKEILKLTLSLYNIPYLSRKSVDEVIQVFHNFISQIFVPFIQKNMEINIKPISSEILYSKAQFVLETVIRIFSINFRQNI